MKRFSFIMIGLLACIMLMVTPVVAQDDDQSEVTSEDTLIISWPPPVTEVWGTGDVLGTVNVPNMVYYYLEYKHLSDDLTEPENAPWVPATIAMNGPVVDSSLATLDTTTVPDGLYSLRLTVNTEDQQSFHYIVSPLRVNNARFEAVEARIRGEVEGDETDDATEEEVVTPPDDGVARVTPLAGAVNVRRCDLVDNDRCPAVDYLSPDEFARVLGRNRNNSWFQIRLESGVGGWVSRTVITESGDFSNIPVITPPTPLPPPEPQPVTTAIPNGMAIEGGRAVCNQTFNVQVNIGNVGTATSTAGTVTLQDVNVRTGEITFNGYGNYPAITPGGNFVVVIPVRTSLYYNEQHELRAFTNGRQFTIRYPLEQGNCNVVSVPAQPPSNQRTFAQGECNVSVNDIGEVYNRAGGEVSTTLAPGTYSALQVQRIGGVSWYQLALENNAPWVPAVAYITLQGSCNP